MPNTQAISALGDLCPVPNVSDIDSFSRCSVYLRLFFNNELLGHATGLLARTDEGIFIVTALHNLTGREPDGRCKSSTGGLPNVVEVTGYNFQTRLSLYDQRNDPNSDSYLFWRHPLGPRIDVCALPIRQGADASSSLDSSFLDPTHHGATVRLSICPTLLRRRLS